MTSDLSLHDALREPWTLDDDVVFLNHGSFGACPREVLDYQAELRAQMERQPVRFFVREMQALLDESRGALAEFVGAQSEDLAWVPNATTAVNAVVMSLDFKPGDELLTIDHGYNACHNVLDLAASRTGARVVVAELPFPCASPSDVVEAIVARVTPRTRIALIDHITSPTGMVLPIAQIVERLAEHGVDTLVDGAHAVGMFPLRLDELGAAYYTSNCHKWLCAPKGSAFLHVQRDRQANLRPSVISHGANEPHDPNRSRFHQEFDWVGTLDPTAWIAAGRCIEVMGALLPGGWPAVRARNHVLALAARDSLCRAFKSKPPLPDSMLGSLAAVPLPTDEPSAKRGAMDTDPLQDALLEKHGIEVPVFGWNGMRLVRVSAQLYNTLSDYEKLADALAAEGIGCGTVRRQRSEG